MDNFSPSVIDKIGNYVYRLVDPRNAETFYVGKGIGNRVFDHVKCAINYEENQDDLTEKIARIKEIKKTGLEVHYIIHRHDIPESAIYEVEAALIDAFPGLTNIQSGHGSGSKGPMTIKELNIKYDLPEITEHPVEKLILININKVANIHDKQEVFKQTQLSWKISDKATSADYILSVYRGIIVGAFIAEKWLPATHENFPELVPKDKNLSKRKGFIGHFAPDHIWDKFVGVNGKRIAIERMKHIQYPIRYWNM
jgi:hypothetical protein